MKNSHKLFLLMSITCSLMYASDESPGEILIPTLGGFGIGGIAGGWKGAAIGGGVGLGVGLTVRSIRKSRERRQRIAQDQQIPSINQLKINIQNLRADNMALRNEITESGGRAYQIRRGRVGYRNIDSLSSNEMGREYDALLDERERLEDQLAGLTGN